MAASRGLSLALSEHLSPAIYNSHPYHALTPGPSPRFGHVRDPHTPVDAGGTAGRTVRPVATGWEKMGQQREWVEKLFGDALDMAPEARRAFLDAACRDEPELKRLVEELLMEDERAGSFLKEPLVGLSKKAGFQTDAIPLTRGTRLGPYEILAAVGAGGMGEVYRARDTRLGRDVAIKVLSTQLSFDRDLKRRFEREARAVSSLTHPNICY